jgi:hypothetical protein
MSVWLTPAEIKAKPVTGPAWLAVQGAAKSAWGTAKVSDQNSVHDVNCLAGALYAVRVDDGAMRTKVGENCRSAIGTEKGGRTLALGRNLAAYCAAADTVDYRDPEFIGWVKSVLAEPLDGMTLRQCQEKRGNNWGAMATMSRIAAAVYLRDIPELARAVVVFQGWLGDRSKYAGFKWGGTEWQADPLKPVGINAKGTTKQGHPVDGCLPDDQRRAGGFKWPPPAENYVRGALGPMYVAAEILRNNGYADVFSWSDSALRRGCEFFVGQCKGTFGGDDAWQPYLIRASYSGVQCPGGSPTTKGKPWGWTGWTHG